MTAMTDKAFEDAFADGAKTEKPANPAQQLRDEREQRESDEMKEFTSEFKRDATTPATGGEAPEKK